MSTDSSGIRVAMIGTRTPEKYPEHFKIFKLLVASIANLGMEISTGAAPGCDQVSAEIALGYGTKVRLVLPWPGYESGWSDPLYERYPDLLSEEIFNKSNPEHKEWVQSVHKYHPAVNRLSPGAFSLHARNFGILVGCSAVVALPSHGLGGGGTGQGIRIAKSPGISVYDLQDPECQKTLLAKIEKMPRANWDIH